MRVDALSYICPHYLLCELGFVAIDIPEYQNPFRLPFGRLPLGRRRDRLRSVGGKEEEEAPEGRAGGGDRGAHQSVPRAAAPVRCIGDCVSRIGDAQFYAPLC